MLKISLDESAHYAADSELLPPYLKLVVVVLHTVGDHCPVFQLSHCILSENDNYLVCKTSGILNNEITVTERCDMTGQ